MAGTYSQLQLSAYIDQFFERLQRIEAQLAVVSEKLGVPFDYAAASAPPEVVELARAGNRLGAITKYRELTGAGLEEAQDFVAKL